MMNSHSTSNTTSNSWSASRKAPAKGCLSHTKQKKKQKTSSSPTTTTTVRRVVVQFGSPRAVEFDASQPSTQDFWTPLPLAVTRQRYYYSTTTQQDEEAKRMSEETKRNSALLAEWEDDEFQFPLRPTSSAEARRRRHERQNHRRSSSLFTPSSPHSTSLLDDDCEDDCEDHVEDTATASTSSNVTVITEQQPPNEEEEDTEPSPPSSAQHATTMDLENKTIASLCVVHVNSPLMIQQQQQQQPTLTPASSGSTTTSSDESSSSSSPSSSRQNMDRSTTELAIPLNMVHVHGAAAANMRQQQKNHHLHTHNPNSTTTTTTTTGVDSTATTTTTRRHLSSPMISSQMSSTTTGSSTKKNSIVPTILLSLLQDPSSPVVDPIWDFADICWALATTTDQQQHTTQFLSSNDDNKNPHHPQMLILQAVLNPQWDGVVSCLEDLHEQVRLLFCCDANTTTKSHTTKLKLPFATSQQQQTRAQQQRMVLGEWIQLEREFLSELTQVLQRNTAHAKQLWHKACQSLESNIIGSSTTTTSLRTTASSTSSSTHRRPNNKSRRQQQLERDIVKLEEIIYEQEEQRFQQLQEAAAEAPYYYASLYCQATSHMGICGFRFDAFQDETCTLQLTYEHSILAAVGGVAVETQCTFDVRHGEWEARYSSLSFEEDAVRSSSPESSLLPPATSSHPAVQFHQHVATTWFANHSHDGSSTNGLLWRRRRLGDDLPLQDALLTLSLWLGELDVVTQDLVELSQTHGLQVEWPRLILSIHDDDNDDATTTSTLTLVYDDNSLLRPSRCIWTQNGRETPIMMRNPLRCGAEKPHLVSSILQDCLGKSSTRKK